MQSSTSPTGFLKLLLSIIAVLFVGNAFSIFAKHYLGYDVMLGLVPLFSFNAEANIPTLFSSLMMLVSSALTLRIWWEYLHTDGPHVPWLGLTIVFVFLAVDEFASLHERLTGIVRGTLDTSGLLFYAWVIPYGLAVGIFALAYARFLYRLPRHIMWLFIASGSIFISGAIGMELLGGRHEDLYGNGTLMYSMLFTLEEVLEMVGIALYIYALQRFIVYRFGSMIIELKSNSTAASISK
ncbi:MAG: hypothetical protein AAF098_16205 [Pseudomonadota bacterium]